jgi:hypothetical protein
MADNTWHLLVQGKAFSAAGTMAGIQNAGTRVLRIKQIIMVNAQSAAVTGVLCTGRIIKGVGQTWTSPTSVTPVAMDSGNSALSSVTAGHAGTWSAGTASDLRRYAWSSDEPAVSGATWDELENLIPLNVLWSCGMGDSSMQPLTLKQNDSVYVLNDAGAAGLADISIEFTDAAS